MFSHNHAKNWNPYTIPATPDGGRYFLSCRPDALSTKNPSQFLEWSPPPCVGLNLYTKTVTVGTPPDTTKITSVWIGAGTVAGQVPSGFDPADGKSIASGGSGYVWAQVAINGTTGDIVSVAVTSGGTTPNNTDTSFYYPLGYYSYDGDSASVTNYGCGSVNVAVCRNWFSAEPPRYNVLFDRG